MVSIENFVDTKARDRFIEQPMSALGTDLAGESVSTKNGRSAAEHHEFQKAESGCSDFQSARSKLGIDIY